MNILCTVAAPTLGLLFQVGKWIEKPVGLKRDQVRPEVSVLNGNMLFLQVGLDKLALAGN